MTSFVLHVKGTGDEGACAELNRCGDKQEVKSQGKGSDVSTGVEHIGVSMEHTKSSS